MERQSHRGALYPEPGMTTVMSLSVESSPPSRSSFVSRTSLREARALQEFRKTLEHCRMHSAIDGRPFILVPRLLGWFRDGTGDSGSSNAARVLTAVFGSDERNFPNHDIDDLLKHRGPGPKCWLKVLTVLLQLNYGRGQGQHIKRFWWDDHYDSKLPIPVATLHAQFESIGYSPTEAKNLADRFWTLQLELCTDTFDHAYNRVFGHEHKPLPITRMEKIREGGVGQVYQVEVPCDCIPQSLADKLSVQPYIKDDQGGTYHEFALKVLRKEKDYKDEKFAYDALSKTHGIVQCLGYWEFKHPNGLAEYHVLMEFGAYSLDEFFQLRLPPSDPLGIYQFWRDLHCLTSALNKIHNLSITRTNSREKAHYWGWHLDIKPANILFCEQGRKRGWKIADPGFATFVPNTTSSTSHHEQPTVAFRGGTTSYGPPVQHRDDDWTGPPQVTQSYDIFSLGCVFLEAATWLILGQRSVEQFRWVRRSMQPDSLGNLQLGTDIRGQDRFHNGEDVSTTVGHWITYLRSALRKLDPITDSILDLVQSSMLVKSEVDRISACELEKEMKQLLDACGKKKSTWYSMPDYFYPAFEKEHETAVQKIQHQWKKEEAEQAESNTGEDQKATQDMASLARKSKRYKSSRFVQATLETQASPMAQQLSELDISSPITHDLATFSTPQRPALVTPRRRATTNTVVATTASRSGSMVLTDQQLRSLDREDVESLTPEMLSLDYWGARNLLESMGWLPGSALSPKGILQASEMSGQAIAPRKPPTAEQLRDPPVRPDERISLQVQSKSPTATKPSALGQIFAGMKKPKRWSLSRNKKEPTVPTTSPPLEVQQPSLQAISPIATSTAPLASSGSGDASLPQGMNAHRKDSDEHRYTVFDKHFENRDVVFLIDNGRSMHEHWAMVRDLTSVLVALLFLQDTNGMELYFTSSKVPVGSFTMPQQFYDEITKMRPKAPEDRPEGSNKTSGEAGLSRISSMEESQYDEHGSLRSTTGSTSVSTTDIRDVLEEILGQTGRKTYQRKLTILILTDGKWDTIPAKRDVADDLARLLARWGERTASRRKLLLRHLSIQFIQFGNNQEAEMELAYMDDRLTYRGTRLPDVVDVEKADGMIMKMILGSILKDWDTLDKHDDTATVTSEEVADVGKDDSTPMTPIGGASNLIGEMGGQFARSSTMQVNKSPHW